MLVLSDRLLITYGKKINAPRPLLDMATCDTTPRVSTLFLIVSRFQTVALLLGDCSALCSRPMPKKFWSINTYGTGSQRSPENFTRQSFTALCRSGTSASTARANVSDILVLVSVPRSPARFVLNAPHIFKSRLCCIKILKF